jgi:O-methyltransferase involved in polyketide biosynthesis
MRRRSRACSTWSALVATGSAIVFTYIHRGVIDGTKQFDGAPKLVGNVKRLGEPWQFGLVPEELESYLAGFALELEQDLGADEYRARYFGASARFAGYAFYRIAVARKHRDRPSTEIVNAT